MMMKLAFGIWVAIAGQALAAAPATVERFEIRSDVPAYEGRTFEGVGAYRHIEAVAHVRLDPRAAANRRIADLDKAPRGPDGMVRYSTEVTMLVPADPAKARRVLVGEVPNRGMRLMASILDSGRVMPEFTPRVAPLDKAEGAGTGFLGKRGYTWVWIGWQDKVRGLKANFPPVLESGKPVSGRIHISNVFDKLDSRLSWTLAYPASATPNVTLTVRANQGSPAHHLSPGQYSFADSRTLVIDRPADMDGGAIYELVYDATEATVTGLGFAATRDVIAYLRSGQAEVLAGQTPRLAIGIGGSQSGRYLRDWIYQGFNDDGDGHRVFEGVLPFLSGGRKTFTNARWAEPGRFSRQHEERQVYGDQFPFTYATTTDSVTGKRDGLFATCAATKTCPRTMHVDTSAEFWMAGASLVGTSSDGKRDIAFPEDVRAYFIASGTHQTNNGAPGRNPGNTLASGPLLRALLVDLEDWAGKGTPPPLSRWPSAIKGELARPTRDAVYRLNYIDYSVVPPREDSSRPYAILVPRTDADGNDIPGVRLPQIVAPIGTHLGWNPRKPGFAEGQQAFLAGSFLAFTPKALAERYGSTEAYAARIRAAGEALVRDRLMLPGDVEEAVATAREVKIGE